MSQEFLNKTSPIEEIRPQIRNYINKNPEIRAELAKIVEAQNNPSAQYDLGKTLLKLGSSERAIKCFELAAKQGHPDANLRLGILYLDTKVADFKKIFTYLETAAKGGISEADYQLGMLHEQGNGTKKDAKTAVAFYTKAAKKDHFMAQVKLAHCYEAGLGVTKDLKTACYWYQQAGQNANVDAQMKLGLYYEQGYGTAKNADVAKFWYEKAAEQGNANAQFELGIRYEKGYSVIEDAKQAFKYFELAANNGHRDAQIKVGICYEQGLLGVQKDPEIAMQWYKKVSTSEQATKQFSKQMKQIAIRIEEATPKSNTEKDFDAPEVHGHFRFFSHPEKITTLYSFKDDKETKAARNQRPVKQHCPTHTLITAKLGVETSENVDSEYDPKGSHIAKLFEQHPDYFESEQEQTPASLPGK